MGASHVHFFRKLWQDVLSDKRVNQQSGRHEARETGYYTGEQHSNPEEEPGQLPEGPPVQVWTGMTGGWKWEITCYLWAHGK